MSEDVLEPGTGYSSPAQTATGPRAWLSIARRRFGWFAVLFPVGLVLSIAVSQLWPATYRAHATILIEQQEIPPELVRSTVTAYADERLQIITQRVMTTPTLLELMEEYDLYPIERMREPREKLLERIREDIRLNVISAQVTDPRSGRAVEATIAFELSFRSGSPKTAFDVANRLLTLYQQENRKVRTESVDNTAEFLAEEAEKLRVKIEVAEEQLANFKARNVTDLPELFSVNVELMNRTERELSDITRQLRSVVERERYLEAALTQNLGRIASGADQLATVREELRIATANYGESHPDVLRLQRQL
ncbi:MAG: lipopolysaccharide biosynthesis protein, partial [Pseudomonadota bacterium]